VRACCCFKSSSRVCSSPGLAARSKVSAGADEAGRLAVLLGCGATETCIRVRATTNLSSRRYRNATHSSPLSLSLSISLLRSVARVRVHRAEKRTGRANAPLFIDEDRLLAERSAFHARFTSQARSSRRLVKARELSRAYIRVYNRCNIREGR